MEIKVLGPGCPNCKDMERRVKQALAELNIQANVTKVSNLSEISRYIMITPGLVINEKVKHSGKPLPTKDKIKAWINEALKNAPASDNDISGRKGGCCCSGCDCGE